MSNAEFRDRIKGIMMPAPREPSPIVRVPSDRGYHPPMPTPEQIRQALSGEKTIWNSDGTDGPVLICLPPKRHGYTVACGMAVDYETKLPRAPKEAA